MRAVPPHIKNIYTCLRSTDFIILVIGVYNALYIIVRSPMQKIFETNTTLFFSFFANFYAFCTQLVHETRRKRGLYYTNLSSHDLFIFQRSLEDSNRRCF